MYIHCITHAITYNCSYYVSFTVSERDCNRQYRPLIFIAHFEQDRTTMMKTISISKRGLGKFSLPVVRLP